MKIIKNKFILSIFFIVFMLAGIVSYGTNTVNAIDEDDYENNDDFWSAYPISPGIYPNLCQGDDDWFNISIGVDEVIVVSLEFNGDQNDIELELYDNSEKILDSSYGMGNNESVAWISYVPQSVYIKIYGENNNEAYNMTIEFFAKGEYDDKYEDNDDFPQAPEIFPNYFNNLVNIDTDIYKIHLDHNIEASFDVYNTSNLWVQLYSYDYNWLADFNVVDSHLELDWVPASSEYYYIRVNGPNVGDFYDIDIWVIGDDWAEENDIQDDSEELDLGYYSGFIQNDDDWFIYNYLISATQNFGIDLYYDTAYVLDIALIDEFGSHHGYSIISKTWGKKIEWTAAVDNLNVSIYVHGSDIGLEYNMSLYIYGGSDDWAEENDYWDSTKYLNIGSYDDLVNLDDDYFSFHLKEGDTGKINIYCENHASIWLEEINSKDGSILKTDYSTEDGFLEMEFYADYEYDVIFAVKGNNAGEWYDLELKIDYKDDKGDDGDNKNSDDPFANLDIPGFPIEIVGTLFIISTLAVIFFVKKKKH